MTAQMAPHRTQPLVTMRDLPDPSDHSCFHPFLGGVFSQWHPAPFRIAGLRFNTAEQWMMFCKARLFRDDERADAILAAADPAEQKRLGRAVRHFDAETWDAWKIDVVFEGNLAKFGQDAALRLRLLATAPAMLVEASPRDTVWGVGFGPDDPAVASPARWQGANLLGRVLTAVRDRLA
jgi:ribA/ribD-fused uncharacterized protein